MASSLKFLVAAFAGLCISLVAAQVRPQNPGVWDALDQLRGHPSLPTPDISDLFYSVQPGVDFPVYSEIPKTSFDCKKLYKSGYFADPEAQCQVFHRCDQDYVQSDYLCPNMTLFNQITLTCVWWYDVDCSQASNFYDYSNSRLYAGEDVRFLDDQMNYQSASFDNVGGSATYGAAAPKPSKVRSAVRSSVRSHGSKTYAQPQPTVRRSPQDVYNGRGGEAQPAAVDMSAQDQDQDQPSQAFNSQSRSGQNVAVFGQASSGSQQSDLDLLAQQDVDALPQVSRRKKSRKQRA
ncbi:hypothetical protein RvY_08196 [Ramazzottius varieornatus]|uniref:Chitin-binding type-2 domain-containing protein n=1 Tax=Ramazzottius varieornatus TaxID=947166 RepID=A0A1D1V4Z1_RAMVA|nr:hypothetical protein RvY_08196 [Ramazzottius varieornatus]